MWNNDVSLCEENIKNKLNDFKFNEFLKINCKVSDHHVYINEVFNDLVSIVISSSHRIASNIKRYPKCIPG